MSPAVPASSVPLPDPDPIAVPRSCIVIGAGIVGAAIAYELQKAGTQVTLCLLYTSDAADE